MKYTLFSCDRRSSWSIGSSLLRHARGHPPLSTTEHERPAQQISIVDGITPELARRQINDFITQSFAPVPATGTPAIKREAVATGPVSPPRTGAFEPAFSCQ